MTRVSYETVTAQPMCDIASSVLRIVSLMTRHILSSDSFSDSID